MADTGVTAALTDGEGIGVFTVPKVFKDLIVDGLLGIAAGLGTAGIIGLPQDKATAITAGWVIANAVVHSVYRFLLKWGQS